VRYGAATFPRANNESGLYVGPGCYEHCSRGSQRDGLCDVFAMNADCALQAINSDGTEVAWSVNISSASGGWNSFLPDFQGGIETVTQSSYVNEFGYALLKVSSKAGWRDWKRGPAYTVDPFQAPVSLNAPWANPNDSWPDQGGDPLSALIPSLNLKRPLSWENF
jgi:hypothetical protein